MNCHDLRFPPPGPTILNRPVYPSTFFAAHRSVPPPPAAGYPAGTGCHEPEIIADFQRVASSAPFAVPAGARCRPGRRSAVTLRPLRNFILIFSVPAPPAPGWDRSRTTPGPPPRCARPEQRERASRYVRKCHDPSWAFGLAPNTPPCRPGPRSGAQSLLGTIFARDSESRIVAAFPGSKSGACVRGDRGRASHMSGYINNVYFLFIWQ